MKCVAVCCSVRVQLLCSSAGPAIKPARSSHTTLSRSRSLTRSLTLSLSRSLPLPPTGCVRVTLSLPLALSLSLSFSLSLARARALSLYLSPYLLQGTTSVTAVSASADCSAFVTDKGALYMCGSGARGRLGLGHTNDARSPMQVDLRSPSITCVCVYTYMYIYMYMYMYMYT